MNNVQAAIKTIANHPQIIRVSKDTVGELHFSKADILFSQSDKDKRSQDLKNAIQLGNMYHSKVIISFEDIEGPKQVETTVWGITDCEVILKKNVTIPINRIVSIQY